MYYLLYNNTSIIIFFCFVVIIRIHIDLHSVSETKLPMDHIEKKQLYHYGIPLAQNLNQPIEVLNLTSRSSVVRVLINEMERHLYLKHKHENIYKNSSSLWMASTQKRNWIEYDHTFKAKLYVVK